MFPERPFDRRATQVGVPRSEVAVDDAADLPAAALVQVVDREFHALVFVGTDLIDFRRHALAFAVDEHERRRKPVRPVAEILRFSPDGDRAAELDSRKPLEIVVRQNLEPEPARRQLLRQRHEQHIYAAVNGIVGVVRRDDDHVLLFVRDARMIAVLPGDGEHVIPDIFADVRMMAENP